MFETTDEFDDSDDIGGDPLLGLSYLQMKRTIGEPNVNFTRHALRAQSADFSKPSQVPQRSVRTRKGRR